MKAKPKKRNKALSGPEGMGTGAKLLLLVAGAVAVYAMSAGPKAAKRVDVDPKDFFQQYISKNTQLSVNRITGKLEVGLHLRIFTKYPGYPGTGPKPAPFYIAGVGLHILLNTYSKEASALVGNYIFPVNAFYDHQQVTFGEYESVVNIRFDIDLQTVKNAIKYHGVKASMHNTYKFTPELIYTDSLGVGTSEVFGDFIEVAGLA